MRDERSSRRRRHQRHGDRRRHWRCGALAAPRSDRDRPADGAAREPACGDGLNIQRNKTDRSDAHGLAQLVRIDWFRPVHVKSEESHRLRLLLTHRRTLKRKLLDIENEIRQSLKVFGLLLGARVQRGSFVTRVRELTAHDALFGGVTDCMLRAWSALWSEYKRLHALLIQFVDRDELCRRFVAIPGVGPVTALSFKAAVDDPNRFAKSKTIGAHFGLTARRIQSGDTIDIEATYRSAVMVSCARRFMKRQARCWSARRNGARLRRGASRSQQNADTNARSWRSRASLPSSCVGCGSTAASFALRPMKRRRTRQKGSQRDAGDCIVNAPPRGLEAQPRVKTTTH